jgi:hypothetical protein
VAIATASNRGPRRRVVTKTALIALLLVASGGEARAAPVEVELASALKAGSGFDSNVYYGLAQLAELPRVQSSLVEAGLGLELGVSGDWLRMDVVYGGRWRQTFASELARESALDHTLELAFATTTRGLHIELAAAATQFWARHERQAGWLGVGASLQLAWSWGGDRKVGLDYVFSQLWYREDSRERRQALQPVIRWRVLGGVVLTLMYPVVLLRAEPSGVEHGPRASIGWALPGLPLRAKLGYQLAVQHVTDEPRRVDLYHMPSAEISATLWGALLLHARYTATIEPSGRQHQLVAGLGVALDWHGSLGTRASGSEPERRQRLDDALRRYGAGSAQQRQALASLAPLAQVERVLPTLREALTMQSSRELLEELRRRLGRGESLHAAAHAIVDQLEADEPRPIGARRRR